MGNAILDSKEIRFFNKSIDFWVSISILVILYKGLINGAILVLSNKFGSLVTFIYYGLFLAESVVILVSMILAIFKKAIIVMFTYSSVIMLYLLTMIFYPQNTVILIESAKDVFLFCVPSLICFYILDDYKYLWSLLNKYLYLVVMCGIIYIFNANLENYSMWFGYQMLLPTMILIHRLLVKNNNVLDFLTCILAVLLIIVHGSRGPLLCLLFYIVVLMLGSIKRLDNNYMIKKLKINKTRYNLKILFMLMIFCCVGFYIIYNLQDICRYVYSYLLKNGYEVRTLRILSENNGIRYVSGRDEIISIAVNLIKSRSILGYGIAGDCIEIGKRLNVSESEYAGCYTHNLFFEVLVHYGVFVGVILLVILSYLIIKKLKTLKRFSCEQDLFIVLLIYWFVYSMISGTYLTSVLFWSILGWCLRDKKNVV